MPRPLATASRREFRTWKATPRQAWGGLYTIHMTISDTVHKIINTEQLAKIVSDLKKQGKKIVTTNGAFDILHVWHKRALEESKSLGDILIVGLNSDSSVKGYKSKLRPIISENERAEIVAAFACVDYVAIFNEPDPLRFLDIVKPDIHTKSGDYKVEELIEYPILMKQGTKIVIIPVTNTQSTTKIIDRILNIYGSKNSQK